MPHIIQNILRWGHKVSRGRIIFLKNPRISEAIYSFYRNVLTQGGRKPRVKGFQMCIPNDAFFTYAIDDYEPSVTNVFLSLIHPGNIVIDIGANIGYYTLQAARQVGKDGLVYAFEPDPDNFKALTENIDINSLTNVKAIQKAVSNRTGTTKLYKKDSQSHSMCNHTVIPTKDSIIVETIALDDFLCSCPASVRNKITLIKIDVEGAEPFVLEGMGEFLNSKNELTMISELIPNFYAASKPSDYISQLRTFGFEISIIKENGTVPLQDEMLPKIDGPRGANLLCSKSGSPLITSVLAAST